MQSCSSSVKISKTVRTEIVELDNKTQDEIYIRANTWMVESFHNAESVIQFSDKEDGILAGRYSLHTDNLITSYGTYGAPDVFANIKIQVKDGAAKITIVVDDFLTYSSATKIGEKELTSEYISSTVDGLISSFQKGIQVSESF